MDHVVDCLWWGGWLVLLLAFLIQRGQRAGRDVDHALNLLDDPYHVHPDDAARWGSHRTNPARRNSP